MQTRTMQKWVRVCSLLLALMSFMAMSDAARAVPITFTFTGESGSGSIGATSFSNLSFTITGQADTSAVLSFFPSVYFVNHTSASIDIQGLGSFTFVSPTRTFYADGANLPGFGWADPINKDLYDGPSNAALSGWDMTTAIGPVSGTAKLLQWGDLAVMTDGGQLRFDDGTTNATFTASLNAAAVPVPGAFLLFGSGLGTLALVARRRRQSLQPRA